MKVLFVSFIFLLCFTSSKAQFWVYSGDSARVLINTVLKKYDTRLSDFKELKLKYNKSSKEYKKMDSLGLESKSFPIAIKKEELNRKSISKEKSIILQKFKADSVESISLMLENVKLGPKANLYFISGDLSEFAGPVTSKSLKDRMKLFMSTGFFNSQEIYLLLVDEDSDLTDFDITSFDVVESKNLKSKARISSVSPSSDCYQQYNDQSFSVGNVQFAGRERCTFSVINNEAQNRKAYALTARHCIATNIFDLNLDPSDYGAPLTGASFVIPQRYNCGTTNNQGNRWQSTGATYKGSEWPSDFLLIEMDDALPVTIKYLGWDRTAYPTNTNIYSIHQPGNIQGGTSYQGRQVISFGNIISTSGKYGVSWTLGETVTGSSGGPLFAPNNRIIGGLSYGKPPLFPDKYFKISSAWTTNPYGLKQFLSPNQNLNTIQVLDPVLITGPTLLCFGQNATINMPNLLANENVTWSVSNGLNIISSTGKSIVVSPINTSYLGMVTVTANFSAQIQDSNPGLYPYSKSYSFWVGKPTNSITNSTTSSTSSGYSINFSQSQTNTLIYNNQSFPVNISWVFPVSWSKSGSIGSPVSVYSWSGSGPFTLNATNTCGTTSSLFYVSPVSIIPNTVVYPNEVSDVLFIKTGNNEIPIGVDLIDPSSGKVLKSYNKDGIQVGENGDYFINVKGQYSSGLLNAIVLFESKKETFKIKIVK